MKRLFFAACLMVLPGWATADNCDAPNLTGFDSVYCFSKVYIGEDNRLNANYQELRRKLSSADRATLRNAQLSWISWRDATCMTGPT
ncbi:MAG: lysozyme inhibitor LprI family protein, partial [Pseudomonadota bacterium]